MDDDRHAWERAGAYEQAPGIYRIPLPLPGDHLKAVNVYAIDDGDELVLIDGGWAMGDSQQVLARSLASIGRELGQIREFLVTHVHRDHYTQAVALRRAFGGSVSLGEGERACLEAMRTTTTHPDSARLLAAGAPELAKIVAGWLPADPRERDLRDWEDPDRWLHDRVELPLHTRTLQAICTPGHTRGHMIFHDAAANVLFAGDHVLPHITPSIGVELVRPPSPLRDYLASLQLTKALPDATLLPAHGPAGGSLHARVDELLAHHEQRLAATLDAIDRGASTGFEVATALTWTRRRHRLADLDEFNQIMAVNETVAHLEVLVERGRLAKTQVEKVVHFARP